MLRPVGRVVPPMSRRPVDGVYNPSMRTFLVLALGLALLLPACGSGDDTGTAEPAKTGDASGDASADADEPQCPTVTATWRGDGNLLEFSAWEMSCGGCESTVKKRIRAIDGVAEVEADKDSSVVKVTLDEGVDRDALAEQITQALEAPESGKTFEIIRAEQ